MAASECLWRRQKIMIYLLRNLHRPHARQFRSPCDRSQRGRYQRHGNHQLTFSSCLNFLKDDMCLLCGIGQRHYRKPSLHRIQEIKKTCVSKIDGDTTLFPSRRRIKPGRQLFFNFLDPINPKNQKVKKCRQYPDTMTTPVAPIINCFRGPQICVMSQKIFEDEKNPGFSSSIFVFIKIFEN